METPPQSPTPESPQPPASREQIEGKVKPPAIALIVVAAIGILFAIISVLMNILGLTAGALEGADEPGMQTVDFLIGGGAIVQSIVAVAVGAFIIFGAIQMMKLQSWAIALAASIVAMIPFLSPCCLLGLPFGIWAIVVLVDSNVKAAFNAAP